jgi:hypothetical protein
VADAVGEAGVWDLVFFNMQDFGSTFHKSGNAVPSPYGPIMLGLDPGVLSMFKDVAVCFRSAGAKGFNRAAESATNIEEFRSIFLYDADTTQRRWIKDKQELNRLDWVQSRRLPVTSSAEISCAIASGIAIAPFEQFLKTVVVDPITFQDFSLYEAVMTSFASAKLIPRICHRSTKQQDVFYELLNFVAQGETELTRIANSTGVSERLRLVLSKWLESKLNYQFSRYSRYTFIGTISELKRIKAQRALSS